MESDSEALERLWRAHAATIVRYAARRVHPDDVDDVVAETFLIAWRRIDDVPDRALPWLLAVARGVSANSRRSVRRRSALSARLRNEAAVSDRDVEANDPSDRMLAALDQLSDSDRELLTLICWDGVSHAEAAEALACSQGALAVRLHRARARLRIHWLAAGGSDGLRPDPRYLDTEGSDG